MSKYNFDGHGINGADEYKSRLATLTDEGHAQNVGNLFAAAPELLEALQEIIAIQVKGHSLIDRMQFSEEGRRVSSLVLSAIEKAKG